MSGLILRNSTNSETALFSNKLITISAEHNYSYPLLIKSIDESSVFIVEGKIYGKSLSETEAVIRTHFEHTDFIENFLFDIDGEFNIFLIDLKNGIVTILGDHLNRLP